MDNSHSTARYYVCHTDRYYLVKETSGKQFDTILSGHIPDMLNELCDRLTNDAVFSELDAIERYCQERRDTSVFGFLLLMDNP